MKSEEGLGPFANPEPSAAQGGRPPEARIRGLVANERFMVLCTRGETSAHEPMAYGSLVAFAASDDLREVAFVTPRTTRKYGLLAACGEVALVFDSRSRHAQQTMEIEAVTAVGVAEEVTLDSSERYPWQEALNQRHPELARFVVSPSCALFRIRVRRYVHVQRFQEVFEWTC